ncbi:MAG: class IV adenylate cyclase [Candidatus Micrarchaeota archaeon]|nr:class IV adenylate cyclase [Candidatus Micrarchaeota archaeon]
MREIETKIVDFDEEDVERSLNKNAEFVSENLQRRWVFDLRGEGRHDFDKFIRVRTNGDKTTIAYKFREGKGVDNTEELEVNVDNFDTTAEIFTRLIDKRYYQENKRKTYRYGKVEITIDYWPKIPPVIEIEGNSEGEIEQAIAELKIKGRNLGNMSWEKVYASYGLDIHSFKILKF